jgi:large subunit ribosomal protein L34e
MPIKRVRTPGGRLKIVEKPKKTEKHKCAICKKILHGMPHGKRPVEVRKLAKTERRPERIFGGNICPDCLKQVIHEAVLVEKGDKTIEEVPFKMIPYVEVIRKRIKGVKFDGEAKIEPGYVVIKVLGRDAASLGVIVDIIDENYIKIITLERKKPRKCNIRHIIPTSTKIEFENEEDAYNKLKEIKK